MFDPEEEFLPSDGPTYDPDSFESIEDEPWPDLLEDDVRDEEEDDEPDPDDFCLPGDDE